MHRTLSLLAILATVLFFAFAMSAPAAADPNGPGNNGTVKIVNDNDDPMGADDRDNDPHVCHFHMYGFHFDHNSSGTWQIESWPPTGNRTVVASGTWKADGTGQWAVAGPALADGHYELDAKQTAPGTPGGDKNKVFWVKCNASTTTGRSTVTSPPAPTHGATGATGSTGQNGATGSTGQNGATGSTGQNGSTGTSNGATANASASPAGNAVAGFQSPPSQNAVGAVSPIVEMPGGSTQQSPNAVNGIQTAPVAGVQGLPSTSTDSAPAIPIGALGIVMIGLGGALLRRRPSAD